MSRPSRLWKKLGLTSNFIRVWSEEVSDLNIDDSNITSITINRGSSSGISGVQEHTIEIATTVPRDIYTGAPIHCDLSAAAMSVITRLTGANDTVKPRYFGRIGRQTVDDTGGYANYGGGTWSTTFFGASWQAQLPNIEKEIPQNAWDWLITHIKTAAWPRGVGLSYLPEPDMPAAASQYGQIVETGDPIAWKDTVQKYVDDPGLYVQNTRTGKDRFLTYELRWNQAQAALEDTPPLTRSQALSPAQWDQPNAALTRSHRVYWTGADGVKWATTGEKPSDPDLPIVEYDLKHIRWSTNEFQPWHVALVGYGQEINTGYRIPTITIDMLRLITSPVYYHRLQARYILALNMGDPIYLSNDWHWYLRGIHFASGITEKITPDAWEITLSLTPSAETVGEWTPQVPAQIWESARYPWSDETRRWGNA